MNNLRESSQEQDITLFCVSQRAWRPKNPLHSFRHASDGLIHALRTQRNLRFHFCATISVLCLAVFFGLKRVEIVLLCLTCASVVILEMINTVVETVVDMITLDYHPAAKIAKDVAAGAVLVASLNAVVVGCILFFGVARPWIERFLSFAVPSVGGNH